MLRRPLSLKHCLLPLFLFLLFFPKGGIKLGPIPITWGYLLLALFSLSALFQKHFSFSLDRCKTLLLMLPFQILSALSFLFLSIERMTQTLSFLLTFFFLPYIFFLLFSKPIDQIDEKHFVKLIKKGVLFISCYGIFLFSYKIFTGQFLCIPLLTMNLGDYQDIDQKCIDRGFGFKLISTFNNGNLYGICLLMLLPIYCLTEKSFYKKGLCKLSLLLTLSRTVWIGFFAYELLYTLIVSKNKKLFFIKAIISAAAITSSLSLLAFYYDLPLSFFLDHTLGGRAKLIAKSFQNPTLFPNIPFQEIREAVYPSIFEQFGLIGLFTFLLFLTAPFLVKFMQIQKLLSTERGLLLGIILYWILCFSDGAILLIPTMVFYLFISSLLLKNRSTLPISSQVIASSV
jgi:hypothetical protein